MRSRIAVFARLTAVPGRAEELVSVLEELVDATRSEPGTVIFVVHRARDDADTVLVYELYEDEAALTSHRDGTGVAAVVPKLAGLVTGPPEILFATPVSAKGIDLGRE